MGERRPQHITAQALQALAIGGTDTSAGVKVEAVGGSASSVFVLWAGTETQDLTPSPWPDEHHTLHGGGGALGQQRVAKEGLLAIPKTQFLGCGVHGETAFFEQLHCALTHGPGNLGDVARCWCWGGDEMRWGLSVRHDISSVEGGGVEVEIELAGRIRSLDRGHRAAVELRIGGDVALPSGSAAQPGENLIHEQAEDLCSSGR